MYCNKNNYFYWAQQYTNPFIAILTFNRHNPVSTVLIISCLVSLSPSFNNETPVFLWEPALPHCSFGRMLTRCCALPWPSGGHTWSRLNLSALVSWASGTYAVTTEGHSWRECFLIVAPQRHYHEFLLSSSLVPLWFLQYTHCAGFCLNMLN